MYFPFMRGKLHELLALQRLGESLAAQGNVWPVLEPVKRGAGDRFFRQIARIAESGVPLCVVENPSKGPLRQDPEAVRKKLLGEILQEHANIMPSFLVGPGTNPRAVQEFLSRTKRDRVAIVHVGAVTRSEEVARLLDDRVEVQIFRQGRTSEEYRRTFSRGLSVSLADSFNRQPRNVDYPVMEFFSDALTKHRSEGYGGFGDFLVVGDFYRDSGGRALAVAIHHTNQESNGDVWIRHFLSDRTEGLGVDTPGKFREALRKLVRFIRSEDNSHYTEGCREFVELHRNGHFPGLGVVKQLSMRHHIELIANAIPPATSEQK